MKVGPSFSEYIHTQDKTGFRKNVSDALPTFRSGWFVVVLFVGIGILFLRLFWLQIIQGNYYKTLSDSNRIRTLVIHAPRGIIFDRNNKPLVYNVPGYQEVIHGKTQFFTQQQALSFLANNDTHLEITTLRSYPYQDIFSHVVGYIGQISPTDLATPAFSSYLPTDEIGQMGIEQSYESVLKGLDGKTLIEVDSMGKKLKTLGTTDPTAGQNITLTLDTRVQTDVYNAMKQVVKGAAIVSRPNGEILAMVSKPSFDPNLFTMGSDYAKSQVTNSNPQDTSSYHNISQILLDNSNQPLLNRAISGQYPPGSTFKLLVAASALENNIISPQFTIEDTGVLKVGDFSFANWYYTGYGKTDGTVDVTKAIQRSNDIFFYKVGQLVGVDHLAQFVGKFGLGKPLGIDIKGEAAGLVPTTQWKEKVIGDKWYLGDDYHLGIGQGYLLTTPLQVNAWTQAIANAGTLYIPHLLQTQKPVIMATNLISESTQQLLRQGMIEACSPGGVAYPLFNFTVKNPKLQSNGQDILAAPQATLSANSAEYKQVVIACKTGTAQVGGDTALPHSWITLFAPAYHPQIIVTVLAESAGEGSDISGPVAAQILKSYFENTN